MPMPIASADTDTSNAGHDLPTVESTVITKTGGATAADDNLSKVIGLGPDGQLKPDASQCWVSQGTAERRFTTGPQETANLIDGCAHNQALVLGARLDSTQGPMPLTTQSDLMSYPGAIARDQAHINYRPGMPALGLFDFDPKYLDDTALDVVDIFGGPVGAWENVLPALSQAMLITRGSTSSGIRHKATKELFPGGTGRHGYFIAKDGADLPRFLKVAHERAILVGLGNVTVGKSGQFLIRSIFDPSVGDGSRMSFESSPILNNPDLVQDKRVPVIREGGVLDTAAACPDLTPEERVRFNDIIAQQKVALKPEADKKHKDWKADRVADMVVRTGCTDAIARKRIAQMLGPKPKLTAEIILQFKAADIGTVAFADVLKDPQRFHFQWLADPVEGPGYGYCARLFVNEDGSICVYSHAHGLGAQYWHRAQDPTRDFDDGAFDVEEDDQTDEQKAEEKAEAEKPAVVSAFTPRESAKLFVKRSYRVDGLRTLHHHLGNFERWNGTHYVTVDKDSMRSLSYKFLADSYVYTEEGNRRFHPDDKGVNKFIDALKAGVQMDSSVASPCWLGSGDHPPAVDIFACKNGLLHLPTKELHAHTPAFFSTNASPVAYDPDVPDPVEWLKFLRNVWPDDQESIDSLQQIFGLMLTRDTSFQKHFLLFGPPRSGKGVISKILDRLFGPDNVAALTMAQLAESFGLQSLINKQVGIFGDVRFDAKGRLPTILERLLSISGEDKIPINRKNKDYWSGRLYARLLLLTNDIPNLPDASGAIATRFQMLKTTISHTANPDKGIVGRVAKELPGVLKWAVDGLASLRARGEFITPASVTREMRKLEDLSSPVKVFVRDQCVIDPAAMTPKDKLYEAWQQWNHAGGVKFVSQESVFARDLYSAFPMVEETRPTINGKRKYCYQGIGLVPRDDDDLADLVG